MGVGKAERGFGLRGRRKKAGLPVHTFAAALIRGLLRCNVRGLIGAGSIIVVFDHNDVSAPAGAALGRRHGVDS